MMSEYEKKEIYQYDKQITLEEKRREGKAEGIKEGMKKGKLEGIKNEKYSIAKTLKQMNMDDASISKATGLSIEEVRKLKAD